MRRLSPCGQYGVGYAYFGSRLNTATLRGYVLVSLRAYAALFSPHGIMNFHRFDRKNNPYGDAIRPIDIPMLIVHIHARQNAP